MVKTRKKGLSHDIIIFALPLILSNILQQLYNTVDLIIVGRFANSQSLAAIGTTGALTNLIIGLFIGISTGACVIVAQYYGAEDYRALSQSVHTAFASSFIGGLIAMVLGILFSRNLLDLMNVPQEILGLSTQYMQIFFCGVIPLIIYNMGASILRAVGDSKRPFYYLIVSVILNVILDLIFVGWFKGGVVGAAIATVISQFVSATLVILCVIRSDQAFRLFPKKIRIHGRIFKQIIFIGLPAGLQSMVVSFSNVIIQSQINLFGALAIAGAAAAGRIDGFLYMPVNAFALTAMTFVGQKIGAKKHYEVFPIVKRISIMSFGVSIFLGVSLLFIGKPILGLFNKETAVLTYGFTMIVMYTPYYWLFSVGEVLGGAIRGSGNSIQPMMISLMCLCVFRIIWMFGFLPFWFDIRMVFLCYPVSWTLNAILMSIYYVRGKWIDRGVIRQIDAQ